jgi:hypothetical protein
VYLKLTTRSNFKARVPRELSPIHHPSSSLTCIAMLRSSSVGTTRIGTTVPPRSIDPRLFQSASDTSTSTFRVRDGRQRGRTDETGAAAGTGTVVSFAVRRSPGLCGVAMRAATRWNMQGVTDTVTDNAA